MMKASSILVTGFLAMTMILPVAQAGDQVTYHLLEIAYNEIRTDSMLSVEQDQVGMAVVSPRLCDGRSYLASIQSSVKQIEQALEQLGSYGMLSAKKNRIARNLSAIGKPLRRLEHFCGGSIDESSHRIPKAQDAIKAAQELKALSLEGLKIIFEITGETGQVDDDDIADDKPIKLVTENTYRGVRATLISKQVAK